MAAHQLLVRGRVPSFRPLDELRILRGDGPPTMSGHYPIYNIGDRKVPAMYMIAAFFAHPYT